MASHSTSEFSEEMAADIMESRRLSLKANVVASLMESSKPTAVSRGLVLFLSKMPGIETCLLGYRSRALTPLDIDAMGRHVYCACVPIVYAHLLAMIPSEQYPFSAEKLRYSSTVFLVAIGAVMLVMACSVIIALVSFVLHLKSLMAKTKGKSSRVKKVRKKAYYDDADTPAAAPTKEDKGAVKLSVDLEAPDLSAATTSQTHPAFPAEAAPPMMIATASLHCARGRTM